jgi:hypothetical protein
MAKAGMAVLIIAGGILGALCGAVSLGLLGLLLAVELVPDNPNDPTGGWGTAIGLGAMGILTGTVIGAVLGTVVMQKVLRLRSSFWGALLGAVAGLLSGVVLLCGFHNLGKWHDGWWLLFAATAFAWLTSVVGAVIGSGRKARPAAPVKPSGERPQG